MVVATWLSWGGPFEVLPRITQGYSDSAPAHGESESQLRRARPPQWDADETLGIFLRDAFEQGLVGQGPSPGEAPAAGPGPAARAGGGKAGQARSPNSTQWSQIVSADTLEDELKASKLELDQLLASPQKFAAGGHLEARRHFAVLAVLMVVIRDYDGPVRWKQDAPAVISTLTEAATLAATNAPRRTPLPKRARRTSSSW